MKKSIRHKLTIGFTTVLVVMITSSIISILALIKLNGDYRYAVENYGFAQGYVGQLGTEFGNMTASVRNLILEQDTNEINSIKSQLDQQVNNINQYLELVRGTCVTEEDIRLYNSIENVIDEFRSARQEVIDLAMQNKNSEAYTVLKDKTVPLANQIKLDINSLLQLNIDNCKITVNKAIAIKNLLLLIIISCSIASIIIGVIISKRLSNSICVPLGKMMNIADSLSKGDLSSNVDYKSDDEIGKLAEAFDIMIVNLKNYIYEISNITNEVSNYNLNTHIETEFLGDFSKIKKSVNNIIDLFNKTFLSINNSAEQVARGSTQVSQFAQSLAEGTTDESSIIQELVATVNEISEKVAANAESAKKTDEISENTSEVVLLGNKQMNQVVAAMDDIQQSTNQIQTIVKAIEAISSQTNLLSLNAAIEAARAGEAGAGFAVVADEIGKLADESGNATKDTISLIEKCIEAAHRGADIVKQTSESLNLIVESTKDSKAAIKSIKVSSNRQAESLKQVVEGIEQVSTTMQSSSSISEEGAATAEELSQQAEVLKNLVGQFNLK